MTLGIITVLSVFSDAIVFFYSPTELIKMRLNGESENKKIVKIGGIIKNNSIIRLSPDLIEFVITDNNTDIKVQYKGILPPLFRDNQGIVAKGNIINNIFIATELLTKHDENYKPPS